MKEVCNRCDGGAHKASLTYLKNTGQDCGEWVSTTLGDTTLNIDSMTIDNGWYSSGPDVKVKVSCSCGEELLEKRLMGVDNKCPECGDRKCSVENVTVDLESEEESVNIDVSCESCSQSFTIDTKFYSIIRSLKKFIFDR